MLYREVPLLMSQISKGQYAAFSLLQAKCKNNLYFWAEKAKDNQASVDLSSHLFELTEIYQEEGNMKMVEVVNVVRRIAFTLTVHQDLSVSCCSVPQEEKVL